MDAVPQNEKSAVKKTAAPKKKSVLKKIDPETAKILGVLKDRANKKAHGRKIRDWEIIGKALSLLEPQHLQELQEATLSEKDRLHLAHEEFMKQHGKLTLDQFIGRLLKGEIRS
jgi:hypothetical protein